MKRVAIYFSFVTASITDALIFIMASDYIQLAVAIILYIPLAYVAFKIFPRKSKVVPAVSNIPSVQQPEIAEEQTAPVIQTASGSENVETAKGIEIFDIDKRAFLKIIGITGISFFISSLFSKRVENQIMGRSEELGPTTIQDPTGNIINPAKHHPTDNYKISEVDYGINTYYGFIDQSEGWFIMKEDLNAGTYRYVKGDANFNSSWNNRENLIYDYFNRVFPVS